MNETVNLHLPQFEADDRIMHDDFNDAFQKLDAAVAACGNCNIEVQTYTGTGTYGSTNPCTLTFAKAPTLVILSDGKGHSFLMHQGATQGLYNTSIVFITWQGTSVSWYSNGDATNQFNYNNTLYTAFIFYAS